MKDKVPLKLKDGRVDRKELIAFLKSSVSKYNQLSAEAKQSLKDTFPATLALFQRKPYLIPFVWLTVRFRGAQQR